MLNKGKCLQCGKSARFSKRYNRYTKYCSHYCEILHWKEKHPKRWKNMMNEWRRRIRLEALLFYSKGSLKCQCCGEKELNFLSIDHINNDGYEHRKYVVKGNSIYSWLKSHNFPKGYQVLCMNCNWGKRMNKGICPHKLSLHIKCVI